MSELITSRGRPLPLGVSSSGEGLNFALHSRHATSVILEILPLEDGEVPIATFELDSKFHRTGDHWHIQINGLGNGFRYGYRVNGPNENGNRFDPSILLLDPSSTILSDGAIWAGTCESDPKRTGRRSLFLRSSQRYDWEVDTPPRILSEDSIIYELHVRGFTCHPSAGVSAPGTFLGLQEKIPYLKSLGITAVELLPIHEFDECDCPFVNPKTGERNRNFWGYNSIAFAAPKSSYAATAINHGQIYEFRDMVKAFHEAGIEVILDVVFNHTGEGDDRGRTFSFRGLDNSMYYMLSSEGKYLNYTGCGNTVNCNHPVVRHLILTCLRFWVGDMHIDGLRFDLASILGRDQNGNLMLEPPVVEMIAEDGVLADTKLIAEPWDAGGAYQVGTFPYGRRWSEWNGRYRDDMRRFWKGDNGQIEAFTRRICGSADLYEWNGRTPRHSINFITCHDGFTLWDLLSYNQKHNEANGEDNRDGMNENYSWNHGIEGATRNSKIIEARVRDAKNLMASLLISQGIPMILGGDEFLRTQQGNNNAWCQDNELSWVDWKLATINKNFFRFVQKMIALRKAHPVFRRKRFFHGAFLIPPEPRKIYDGPIDPRTIDSNEIDLPSTNQHLHDHEKSFEGLADILWHGIEPRQPDFGFLSHAIAMSLDGRFTSREFDRDYHPDNDFYLAFNAWEKPLPFKIPPSASRQPWHLLVDTAKPTPQDFYEEGAGPIVAFDSTYLVAEHSMIILISDKT